MINGERSDSQGTRGRVLLLVGAGLPVLGVIAYAGQISLGRLTVPWYVPVLASLGVVLVGSSLWRRPSLWRVLALIAVAVVAAGEWGLLFAFRLPRYTGPIVAEGAFPEFETSSADGTKFSRSELVGSRNNVLVFFRGRW
jgi:hypothetical protein